GRIAASLKLQTIGKTPLHKKLADLARRLALLVLITVPVIVLFGIISGKGLNEIFLVGLALAVSAIPEGLLVSLTVILTIGMRRILRRRALVRKLAAAETLGNTDIICLDKTGTVTLGKMKVVDAISDNRNLLIKGAILCNDERDPLEAAMMKWGEEQMSINKLQALSGWKRIESLPFDHRFKYIVTRNANEKGEVLEFISGAPEVVLQLSTVGGQSSAEKWKKKFGELGGKGYRLVGFGVKTGIRDQGPEIRREEVKDYEWLGVITFEDPVREGAASSLKKIIDAGIVVKIVTGDYKETAWSVLSAVGLVDDKLDENLVITGDELAGASASRVERAVLFARVSPEQKLHIVKALQGLNHVVAMTGDGVNDAPALKQADIGVV
ncbi:cation-transporting P-type ATPase, partial [Candidatus Collierbacteria bacterium]|nr:cation-transporting P-type ATPase [Candidatus Collierbacteria bacterium]